jgi:hypothetical protein
MKVVTCNRSIGSKPALINEVHVLFPGGSEAFYGLNTTYISALLQKEKKVMDRMDKSGKFSDNVKSKRHKYDHVFTASTGKIRCLQYFQRMQHDL